jgi:nucleoside-diphosphate-sugar epimerase
LRMPTVCVRPGKPNLAASGFFSNIIREPLAGKPAILPVSDTERHRHASPRAAVGFLVQAAELDTARLGNRRTLTLPGLSCTVAEQIEALRRVAGNDAVKLITSEPDETIAKIVSGWPRNFNPQRALSLGFKAEASFDDIIRVHIADELGDHARAAT